MATQSNGVGIPQPQDHSTPKPVPARHERKILETLQSSNGELKGGQQMSLYSGKPSVMTNLKMRENDTAANKRTLTPVIFKDPIAPPNSSEVHCHRCVQTDDDLLKDLLDERMQMPKKRIDDSNDSGRASASSSFDVSDLTANDSVSENYWKDLAEERRRALVETLAENRSLSGEVESLKKEVRRLSEIADEAKALNDMLQGFLSESENEEADCDSLRESAGCVEGLPESLPEKPSPIPSATDLPDGQLSTQATGCDEGTGESSTVSSSEMVK